MSRNGLLGGSVSHSVGSLDDVRAVRVGHIEPSKPSLDGKVSCCIPKRAVCRPFGEEIREGLHAGVVLPAVGRRDPIIRCSAGSSPVNSEPRDGEHSGAVACARVNRMPSAASGSCRGLGCRGGRTPEVATEVVPVHQQHVVSP